MRGLLIVGCCIVLAASLGRAATDPAVKGKVQVVWTAEGLPLRLPMGQTMEAKVPAMAPKAGQLIVLKLQARLDCPANSGWNKFLQLAINGEPVRQTVSGTRNGPNRVLNRDTEWAPAGMENDYMLFDGDRLCMVFAPDFQQYDKRLEHEGEEAFWFVLNVSDLLRADGGNTIKLGNTARAAWFEGQQHDIVLGDLSVGYLPAPPEEGSAGKYRAMPKGKSVKGAGYTLMVTPTGGMAVQAGKEHYLIETSLTWPKGDLNWLDCPGRPAQPGSGPPDKRAQEWRVRQADASRVVAEGKLYRLTREIKLDGPRIRVADRIENLTDRDLGTAVCYNLTSGGSMPALYLAGNDDPALNFVNQCGDNSTVFAAQSASGLGWLAEDDLLRAQLRLRTRRGVTTMSADNFGLKPRESYTLRWTLYPVGGQVAGTGVLGGTGVGGTGVPPVASAAHETGGTPVPPVPPDYWSFINQVRRDWNVNFTIDGPFMFIGHCRGISQDTLEAMKRRFAGRDVHLATMHPWTAYQYPYSRDDHKAWWKVAQPKVHEAIPGAKCLLMMEPPLEGRVHETQVEQDPYRDAMVVNPDGKVAFDMEYGPSYVGKEDWDKGWRLVWRYPTLTNSWGKYLLDDVKFAMQDCGADGMYIDCFSYGFSRGWCRYTYDKWDGHTVDLDPKTHEITRRYTDLSLPSAPACEQVIRAIQAAGGVVVANSEPCTENMRKVRVYRFVETGGGPQASAGTHLYTPIALGFPFASKPTRSENARAFVGDVVANLRWGALYYYYQVAGGLDYGCVNRMFPFTPRELHSGWLVGEERIITTVPGEYGWGDKSGARVWHYDLEGKETAVEVKAKVVGGARVYPVTMEKGEIIILERVKG